VQLRDQNREYWFNASSLAAYFISTANFCNPLTRRELHPYEIDAVVKLQPKAVKHVLVATYLAHQGLQRFAYENQDADTFSMLEGSADMKLQTILDVAELQLFDFSLESLLGLLDEYEDALADLLSESVSKTRVVCVRHMDITMKRGIFCPYALSTELATIHKRLLASDDGCDCPGPTPPPILVPLLGTALLQRLKFH